MPEISIIVPVYNTDQYLDRCVDSILTQSFSDFELILVDDGSIDTSGDMCDKYTQKDSRVRSFHQDNQGQASARNLALEWVFANSDSKYISFIDSDDWIHPRFLELLRKGIMRFHTNICQCAYLETNGSERLPEVSETEFCITPDEQFLHYYSASMCDKLFSKVCWQGVRFPEGQIYEDVAIWYKILFSEQQIAYVDEPLYYYFINLKSTVHMNWTIAHFARIKAWDEIIVFLSDYQNKDVFSNAVYRYCHIAKRQFDEIGQSNTVSRRTKLLYKTRIKCRIFRMLIKYKDEMKNTEIYDYFFSWTFPIISWLYWTCKGITGKISKL